MSRISSDGIADSANDSVKENGCKERKCPCRMWVNCATYVDQNRKTYRLQKKDYDFNEWYKHNFRNEIKMQDITVNG